MAKGNKYGAIKCEAEGKTFDSQLERNVYLTMRLAAPAMLINHPEYITLLPKSVTFPEVGHRIDFYLPEHNIYVEAKGIRLADWKLRMKILNYVKPDVLRRIVVVSEKAGEKCWHLCYTLDCSGLSEFIKRLTTKG